MACSAARPLLITVQAMDLAWVALNYAGIERTAVEPRVNSVADIHLAYMPFSHSVATALAAAAVAWFAASRSPKYRVAATALAVGVVSHLVLDLLTHARDIAVAPGSALMLGTGLYGLGYQRFGACGGDIGSSVAPEIGRLAPERVTGIHVNALVTVPGSDPAALASLSNAEQQRLTRFRAFRETGLGYAQIQGSRPQTISYALTDSPVGQLAWLVEKYKEWTDPRKNLPDEAVDRDRLLTNVMLYWLSGTARSSAASYYERFRDPTAWAPKPSSGVPTAVAVFPSDFSIRRFAESQHHIVRWTEFDRGGHFAALEAPDLYAEDVRDFFSGLRHRASRQS